MPKSPEIGSGSEVDEPNDSIEEFREKLESKPGGIVRVKRSDGTVAKCRGEAVFHGAFTGGFTAGYFNTVDTKEGWAPSTFVSSRSNRTKQQAQRPEDFMDDEDGDDGCVINNNSGSSNNNETRFLSSYENILRPDRPDSLRNASRGSPSPPRRSASSAFDDILRPDAREDFMKNRVGEPVDEEVAAQEAVSETPASGSRDAAPLWQGVNANQKADLLQRLGSRFVVGNTQEMGVDGDKKVKQVIFPDDEKKQRRYDKFCDALDRKIPVKETDDDPDGIGPSEVQKELLEFGRLYKTHGPRPQEVRSTTGRDAASRKPRKICNWRPTRVICACFNVKDPWKKRQFVDDREVIPGKRKCVDLSHIS